MTFPLRNRASRKGKANHSLIFLFLLFMYVIGCDAIGMLLCRVQAKREEARLSQCAYNLKLIGMAMQSYHQRYGCFPPSYIPDENGTPRHSWRVLLLPFLERQDLYDAYRFDEPWNSPHNMTLAECMPAIYRCPTDADADRSRTSYAMIVGPHAVSDGPAARSLREVPVGGAHTILLAEAVNAGIAWLEPRDLNTKDMLFRADIVEANDPSGAGKSDIASGHVEKVHVLCCDGEVREVDKQVDANTLKAMMAIDDAIE